MHFLLKAILLLKILGGRDDYALRIANKSYVLDEEAWNKSLYFSNEFKEDSKLPKPYDEICAKHSKEWQNQKLEIIENGIVIACGRVQDCKIIWDCLDENS